MSRRPFRCSVCGASFDSDEQLAFHEAKEKRSEPAAPAGDRMREAAERLKAGSETGKALAEAWERAGCPESPIKPEAVESPTQRWLDDNPDVKCYSLDPKPEADGKARELYLYNTSNGWYVRGEECVNKRTDILFRRVDPRMVEIDREVLEKVIAFVDDAQIIGEDQWMHMAGRADSKLYRQGKRLDDEGREALALLRTVKGKARET